MSHDNIIQLILTELNDLKSLLEKNHVDQFSSEIEILKASTQALSTIDNEKQWNVDLFYLIEKIYALTEKIETHKEAVFNEIAKLKQYHQAAQSYTQHK